MKTVTCFYDGVDWNTAISEARAGMSEEDRKTCQVIALPESMREKTAEPCYKRINNPVE